jgi:hypothetical protein
MSSQCPQGLELAPASGTRWMPATEEEVNYRNLPVKNTAISSLGQ